MFKFAEDLNLPANAGTQALAFLGRRGSGKTYGAGKLAELFLEAGQQTVIVDPVGTWYGLRLDKRGNAAGIPIAVFGGQRGDIPLEATAGALVAQLVAEKRLSVVLDVSEFSGGEQRRFVADFATELLTLKKRNRSPLMTIWDEAQEFVPQHVRPDHARMVGAMEKVVKLGRNFGIGATLISQRPQAVNKDVLNQAEVLVVFQLTGPQERKVIEGWVSDHGFGKKEIDELPRLQPGTAFVWSPQWLGRFARVKILPKWTFDASATPEAGAVVASGELSPIDLGAVREAMAATIEEAKANDQKALRDEILRLRRALSGANAGGAADERDRLSRRVDDLTAENENLRGQLRALPTPTEAVRLRDMETFFGRVIGAVDGYREAGAGGYARVSFAEIDDARTPPPPVRPPRPPMPADERRLMQPPAPAAPSDGDGAARILRALDSTYPRPLTNAQVGVLAVIKPSGGSFGTYLSRLKVAGHLAREGGVLSITQAGRAAVKGTQPSARELVDEWGEKLGGKTREILRLMTDGRERTKAQIAEEVNVEVNGGSFGTYVSRLRANGLIEKSQRGFTVSPHLRLA